MRHQHLKIADEFKVDTRQRAVEFDDDFNPTRWETETFVPAHVHVIECADGTQMKIHHKDYPRLRELLDGPARGMDDIGDPDEGKDSDAVYIKINLYKEKENVTYQCPVSKAALPRLRADVDLSRSR